MQQRWDEQASIQRVDAIREAIDTEGFARLEGFVSKQELRPLTELATAAVSESLEGYAGYTGTEAFTQTVWGKIPECTAFKKFCRDLCSHETGCDFEGQGFYQIFRCLRGRGGAHHSMRFHYDSYLLTVLLPVAIPERGARGNLLVFPSRRPVRRSYLRSLADKALVHSRRAQASFKRTAQSSGAVSIPMVPGDAYLFWGYRSLHTNMGCDPGVLRATALLHYGDPHSGDLLRTGIRRIRKIKSA